MTKTLEPEVRNHVPHRNGQHSSIANQVCQSLSERDERLVLAEGCTGGMVAATLSRIVGMTNLFCGSLVACRPEAKRRWAKVSKHTIKKSTCDSHEMAQEMAIGALRRTPEATWSVSVVGEFGSDTPDDKNGVIHICIARRTKKDRIKIRDTSEHQIKQECCHKRQELATEAVLTELARNLIKKSERETHVEK